MWPRNGIFSVPIDDPVEGSTTFSGSLDASARVLFLSKNSAGLGRWAEDLAARLLTERGLERVERNLRCGASELDLVGLHGGWLTVVEVRCRRSNPIQSAAETLGWRKWRALVRGLEWLAVERRWDGPMRIDLMAVTVELRQWSALWLRNIEMEVNGR